MGSSPSSGSTALGSWDVPSVTVRPFRQLIWSGKRLTVRDTPAIETKPQSGQRQQPKRKERVKPTGQGGTKPGTTPPGAKPPTSKPPGTKQAGTKQAGTKPLEQA